MSFAAVAAPLAIGSGILQAVGAINEGNAKKAEAAARQQELDREAQLGTIAANEQQATRLRDLNTSIGQIRALVAGRGLSVGSPSAYAVQNSVEKQANRDTRALAFNSIQNASNLRLAGRAAIQSGNAAQTAGYIKAGSSLFKAASSAGSAYG